ncbi:hypothetical protein QIS74_10181 [Colletotrichum tabaci]|uniref:Uncharacterized protein n=1 Tax=Colletotrichum tabaci TaxID=1209068 RepID=A0AAV9T3M1_9PEZI
MSHGFLFRRCATDGRTCSHPAVIVVLDNYDQQPLPDWPLSMTLNTFLAFFTTLSKAAFMLPVSVAISQSQWGWLRKNRPLYDLHVFDQASRGPWGSIMLLWRIRHRHFVTLGAFLMIVSAVTSPITQLAISYPVRNTVARGEEARAPAVHTIVSPADRMDIASRRALVMATLSDSTGFRESISPVGAFCSTGNCTFDSYQSLGICMKTANITSYMRVEEFESPALIETLVLGFPNPEAKVWRASLPGGFEMAHQTPLVAMVDMLNGRASFAFDDSDSLQQARVASFVLMHTIPTAFDETLWGQLEESASSPMTADVIQAIRGFRHEAVEVLFHLCVQTYETKVQMGVETTHIVEQSAELAEGTDPFYLDMNCRPLLKQASRNCNQSIDRWNETLRLKGPAATNLARLNTTVEEGFSASLQSLEKMASNMKVDLVGYASASYVTEEYQDTAIFFRGTEFIKTLFQDVLFSMSTMANHTLHHDVMNNLYTNIATSLSMSMRSGEPQKYAVDAFNISGVAWTQVSYVHISWGWITVLAVEITIAVVFLTLTMVSQGISDSGRGSRQESCLPFRDAKNSSLATLVALSEATRAKAGGGVQPVDELEKIAKRLRVRFEGDRIVPAEEGCNTPFEGTATR